MSDNEIINALELCCTQDGTIPCYDCPCWDYGEDKCEGIDHFSLHSLITRQKAEIEKLQSKLNCIKEENTFLRRYIGIHEERHLSQIIAGHKEIIETAKIEAIKEFVDRLCEGRASNDPVVIAAKVELKERIEE